MQSRPESPVTVGQAEEARYRSLASVQAWTVATDTVVLYGRRFFSFIAASLLGVLPSILLRSWQLRRGEVGFEQGFGSHLLVSAILMLWSTFWVVLMFRLAADEIEGVPEGLGEAVGRLRTSIVIWAVIANFLVPLFIGLATLLLIIPGFIVAVKLSLTLPVIVCEGRGPIAAMKRSSQLVKGHGWSIFGAFFLFFLLTVAFVLAAGVTLVAAKGGLTITRSVFYLLVRGGGTFLQAMLSPLWTIMPTIFYVALASRSDAVEPGPQQDGTYGTMPPVATRSE